ncbi:MAG: DUF2304 family protein [Nanoarchaeota archaeon]|nr:DUF2304 family protein [Nanoarchaeota archaeon]
MISIFQMIVLVFLIFVFTRVVFRFKDRQISILELLFWSALWISAGVLLFMPQITNPIARILNIGRGIDVAVYLGIILLFYLVFRLYVKIDTINQDLTKIVREIAVNKPNKDKRRK